MSIRLRVKLTFFPCERQFKLIISSLIHRLSITLIFIGFNEEVLVLEILKIVMKEKRKRREDRVEPRYLKYWGLPKYKHLTMPRSELKYTFFAYP